MKFWTEVLFFHSRACFGGKLFSGRGARTPPLHTPNVLPPQRDTFHLTAAPRSPPRRFSSLHQPLIFYFFCVFHGAQAASRLGRRRDGAVPLEARTSIHSSRVYQRLLWCSQPASEAMGCGLRKLEDPEDSSPGKIYSTLKRPQVETKTDTVYEYVLLDFSLEGGRVF